MPLIETPIGWIDPLHVIEALAYQYADASPGDYGHVSLTLAGDPEPRRFQMATLPDAQRLVAEIVAAHNGGPAGAPCGSWRVVEWVAGASMPGVTFSPPLTTPARTVWCDRRSGPCPFPGTAQQGSPPLSHAGGWGLAPTGPGCAAAMDEERQPEPGTQTIDLRHEPAILHVGELVAALRTFDAEKEIRLLLDDADKGPTEIDLVGIAWGHGDVTVDATFVRSEPET